MVLHTLDNGLFSPDAGGEAIASCGIAIGSFFARFKSCLCLLSL
jgi:hypothetical protein